MKKIILLFSFQIVFCTLFTSCKKEDSAIQEQSTISTKVTRRSSNSSIVQAVQAECTNYLGSYSGIVRNPTNPTTFLTGKRYKYTTANTDGRQTLDLYLPPNKTNPKVVVLIHGGGWMTGPNNSTFQTIFNNSSFKLVDSLITNGYACAIVKYRLLKYGPTNAQITSNANTFSNIMTDIHSAVKFLLTNAVCLKIAPNEYSIIGESAGGHIALMYANTKAITETSTKNALKTVASFYAPTKINNYYSWFNRSLACVNPMCSTVNKYVFYFAISSLLCNGYVPTDDIAGVPSVSNTFCLANSEKCGLIPMVRLNKLLECLVGVPSTDATFITKINNLGVNTAIANSPVKYPTFLLNANGDRLVPIVQANQNLNVELNTPVLNSGTPITNTLYCIKTYADCEHGWANASTIWNGGTDVCSNFTTATRSCEREQIINDVVKWMKWKMIP